jgi:release factor glutamine methyltransferase
MPVTAPTSPTAEPPVETVAQALVWATAALRTAGVEDAARDARRLLADVLAVDGVGLVTGRDRPLTVAARATYRGHVARRVARMPVARILGRRDFYGRTFRVTSAVLDPRPDTETVVETVLDLVRAEAAVTGVARPVSILDIGTGSGAILATLLAELPTATGLGIDLCDAALACAGANVQALDREARAGIGDRARFARHDLRAGSPAGFDLWVSNPPYIPTGDIATLDPEVRHYDPTLALDGGADGLAAFRAILGAAVAPAPDARPAWVVLEVGAGQADPVVGLARAVGIDTRPGHVRIVRDLGGHARCVAVKPRLNAG